VASIPSQEACVASIPCPRKRHVWPETLSKQGGAGQASRPVDVLEDVNITNFSPEQALVLAQKHAPGRLILRFPLKREYSPRGEYSSSVPRPES